MNRTKLGGGGYFGPGFNQDLATSIPSSSPATSHHGQALDDNNDPFFRCAANRLCRSMGDQTSQFLNCINCNQLAHLFCAEYLIGQTPVDDDTSYITVKDFSKEGKARCRKTPSSEKDNIAFCILCSGKIKAVKVSAEAQKLAKRKSGNLVVKSTPKKKAKSTKATTAIIRELRRVAAFQAQLYIFTKVEKSKADLRYLLIEEQFHGCPKKRIKGACEQLIDGSGAFSLLYDIREGEKNVELVLKTSCCGRDTASSYLAGVHFTADDLRYFGINKKVNGRALWAMGLSVLRSIKKALAIVPKLSPRIVSIDKSCAVIGYASGHNEQSFMQLIDNGMFNMDEAIVVDGCEGSDDDNEVLGSVSKMGMPISREDIDGDVPAEENSIKTTEWDPFLRGSVMAPEGFTYLGKLSFLCFGPTSKFFAATLAMGGQSNHTVAERKEGSRKAQRKVNTERADTDREVGIDRGMTQNARMQCAFMAQNEDDAIQRHRDLRMVMLTKSIESTERLVDLKMKMYDRMGEAGGDTYSLTGINVLMEKLEQLNADLEKMVSEVRFTNPIVGNVLDNAKIAMGLVTLVGKTLAGKGHDTNSLVTDTTTIGMLKCDEDDDEAVAVFEDDAIVAEEDVDC